LLLVAVSEEPTLNARTTVVLRIACSLACAVTFVALERPLTVLASQRPGVLPIAMCALIWGLLVPRFRQTLIVTLCFGIALIAAISTGRALVLPADADYVWVESIYPLIWVAISVLTAVAGVQEAVRPGSVPAARCYFAAVALYMGGCGGLMWLQKPTVEAVVALGIGMLAVVAVVYARRIIGPASEGDWTPAEDDLQELDRHRAERAAALAAKEWKENNEHAPQAR
jgi:hypothetical protein